MKNLNFANLLVLFLKVEFYDGPLKRNNNIMKKYSLLLLCLSFFFQIENKLSASSKLFFQKEKTNEKAYELFKKAEFDKALELYNEIKKEHINDYEANYRAGYIYLLKNDLSLSENDLKKAIELKPEENDPKRCLAMAYYRQDKFQEAAVLFDEIGEDAKAEQLASFGSNTPYKIATDLKKTIIPFIMVDPLPRFYMKVNGKEIIVQLDTGGSELILDSDFAEEIGAQTYGSREGVFGGGMFEYYPAELIEMTLGEAKQKNLNGIIVENDGGLSTRYEYTIDGIISHTFLKNYAVTFDFDNMIITLVN